MSRFITYIFFICMAVSIASCVDTTALDNYSPSVDAHYIEINQSTLSYNANSETKNINIRSSQNWFFSEYANWLNISPKDGSGDANVSISAETNLSADIVRSSIFYLKSTDEGWNHTKLISADQKAATPYIIFSPESLTTFGGASSNRINISSNTKWTAKCNDNWVTLTPANDLTYLDIDLSENLTNSARSTNIIVSGATTQVFTVTQNAANLTTDNNELKYPQSGGSYLLNINSEVTWTASTAFDWIDISPSTELAGESNITISTTPNWNTKDRVGSVRFYIGEDLYTHITIKQEGIKLSTTEEISLRALGESKTVKVESNISWSVISKPNWITISPESGEGNTDITITADNNSESTNRTGVITLGKEGITHSVSIYVTQDGKYFSINNEALSIGSQGGTMQVSINTNDSWIVNLYNNATWLDISDKKGEESKTIDFIVGDNPSVNTRSETARISPRDATPVDVVIRQNARYLNVDSDGVQFFSKGGKSSPITISTDGVYIISKDADWFSFSHEDNILVISADTNKTGQTRSGNINISLTDLTEGSMTLTLKVTQVAPGGNFDKADYSDDKIWDSSYNSKFTVSVIGYANDQNWDEKTHHGITLTITGYKVDENWDGIGGKGSFGKDSYPNDGSYDAKSGSCNINKGNFSGDEKYDN